MGKGPGNKKKNAVSAGGGIIVTGFILIFGMISISEHPAPFVMQTASASNQYGILGRQAPEFGLNTWIDGDGKAMDPIEVSDYRGKVIYLYFFQDW